MAARLDPRVWVVMATACPETETAPRVMGTHHQATGMEPPGTGTERPEMETEMETEVEMERLGMGMERLGMETARAEMETGPRETGMEMEMEMVRAGTGMETARQETETARAGMETGMGMGMGTGTETGTEMETEPESSASRRVPSSPPNPAAAARGRPIRRPKGEPSWGPIPAERSGSRSAQRWRLWTSASIATDT
jgi:hypothetical protein